jgi:hypothetical protein
MIANFTLFMKRTLPSLLSNSSGPETKQPQVGLSDVPTRAILSLLCDFMELTMSASIGILLDAWRCVGDKEALEAWAPLTSVKSFVSQFFPQVGRTCCRSGVPLTLNTSESRLTWISGHPCES